jgi:uncharacterized membrane protein (UPF0182 family)
VLFFYLTVLTVAAIPRQSFVAGSKSWKQKLRTDLVVPQALACWGTPLKRIPLLNCLMCVLDNKATVFVELL